MHGIFGTYHTDCVLDFSALSGELERRHKVLPSCTLYQYTLPKFLDDKVFCTSGKYEYVLEGVILNANQLMQTYECLTMHDLVSKMHRQLGDTFFSQFRGSFCGAIYDTELDQLILYTDQIGSKNVFYAKDGEGTVFASELKVLSDSISKRGKLEYDEGFMYSILLYGFSPVYHTIYDGILRIPAGTCLRIRGNHLEIVKYHRFHNRPNALSLQENIDRLNELYSQAIKRVLEKNAAYHYMNYLPLSAGLDSRMTNCVAKTLTDDPITNITYSQTGFYDEIVPKQLSGYWGNRHVFQPLDGGICLKELDTIIAMTEGLLHYSGAAESWQSFRYVNPDDVGVVLTGINGDQILNISSAVQDYSKNYVLGDGALIPKHLDKIKPFFPKEFWEEYENKEIFYLYVRAFMFSILGSPLIQQNIGETYSPFSDVDLVEFICSIPLKYRRNYFIYDQWVMQKYPDMLQWKHNGIYTIGHRSKVVKICGREIALKDVAKRMCWKILKELRIYDFYRLREGQSMNPEDSWFEDNEDLKQFANDYYRANRYRLEVYPEILKIADEFFHGDATEKMQVLTLLGILKRFNS